MSVVSRCDLCGAIGGRELRGPGDRALRSDRRIVSRPLRKIECAACGLVRGDVADIDTGFYEDDYRVDAADHVFHTAAGPRRRSVLMANWIVRATATIAPSPARVLEIGSGCGFLLAELSARWPGATLSGLELNAAAAAAARARGLNVTGQPAEQRPSGAYDLIVAVAVLEHVPSPTAFLRALRRLLTPHGHAVLIQPTQAVPSYDVLFLDHLHHFGVAHVRAYARKCGFVPLVDEIGFELMPNFSAHVWRADTGAAPSAWDGPPHPTCAVATVAQIAENLARLEDTALALKQAGRAFGVFGLHEAFAVVRAYSTLERIGIAAGVADDAANPEYAALGFPVVAPEACRATGIADVFLTMNRVHYPFASTRLAALGVRAIPVFSEQP